MRKIIVLAVISLWGLASMIALAADEAEDGMVDLTEFITVKVAALASLGLCVWAGVEAHRRGWLPEPEEED